jgi:plasmid stabilization system protein ParE
MRKDMTKAEFEAWTRDAEQKRDAALDPYARAESEEERQRIAQEVAEALNEA